MFVQVISGRVADAQALRRQLDRWVTELQPGAAGYLGTTAGITADGTFLAFARFESEAAAKANSDRPEQGAWWAETEKCFAEAPTFEDSTDVEEWLGGGSDDAGFVQVMRSTVKDRKRLAELDQVMEGAASERPDLLGGLRVWTTPDTCLDVAYFTSEAEARIGEKKEPPPELQEAMQEMMALSGDMRYHDLTDPWLYRG
jgi:hypothetical protein